MTTLTCFTLVFVFFTFYLNSVTLHSSESGRRGRPCLDSCQCRNGTACLPANAEGRRRCQECDCRLADQCVKLRNNTILCDCSDSGYTGVFCETKIEENACPDDWITVGGRCYGLITEQLDWASAQAYCQARGAYLAEGDSNGELDALEPYRDAYSYYWVGLTDQVQENSFVWYTTGEELNTAEYSVQFNGEDNDCVYSYNFALYARSCDTNLKFFCELDV